MTAWIHRIALLVGITVLACARTEVDAAHAEEGRTLNWPAEPNTALWGAGRLRAWRSILAQPAPPPLAILRIPAIGLEAAVLPGTSDFVLNRAIGHIDGTSLPGTGFNSGLAGHRDGFFRGLKDIAPGDTIELETLDGHEAYRVEHTWIVDPTDTSVLGPTAVRSVTLVTCYPFYFVGSAPQRFIVRATRGDNEILSRHQIP